MIILDTCALVWLVDSPHNLSKKALQNIKDSDSLAVLPISAWEIALKCRNGGIQMKKNMDPLNWYSEALTDYGMKEIQLNAQLLCSSVLLPPIHRDPCDRIIIAAAIEYRCAVVTADKVFSKYPQLEVVW